MIKIYYNYMKIIPIRRDFTLYTCHMRFSPHYIEFSFRQSMSDSDYVCLFVFFFSNERFYLLNLPLTIENFCPATPSILKYCTSHHYIVIFLFLVRTLEVHHNLKFMDFFLVRWVAVLSIPYILRESACLGL